MSLLSYICKGEPFWSAAVLFTLSCEGRRFLGCHVKAKVQAQAQPSEKALSVISQRNNVNTACWCQQAPTKKRKGSDDPQQQTYFDHYLNFPAPGSLRHVARPVPSSTRLPR